MCPPESVGQRRHWNIVFVMEGLAWCYPPADVEVNRIDKLLIAGPP
jgi:hypothetical protein